MKPVNCKKEKITQMDTCSILCKDAKGRCVNHHCKYCAK